MNSNRDSEKEIIEFLMSYPESVPSQAEKARTVIRVQREIRKNRATRMNSMDILFVLLLLAAALFLSFFIALPEFLAEQILQHYYQLQYSHLIVLFFVLSGLITTPLLLTLLPSNKGGNH